EEDAAEDRRGEENQKNAAGEPGGRLERSEDLLQADFPVDEDPDEESVEDRHDRRVGRREEARVDAAEDDERREQRPEALVAGRRDLADRQRLSAAAIPGPAAPDVVHQKQTRSHHEAGQEAGDEQL